MITGYKGFNAAFQCREFQYEIGGEYKHEGKVEACASGFHFCENPLDVFSYYSPANSRFAAVIGLGESKKHGEDSKVACATIKIERELTLAEFCDAAVKYIFENVNWDSVATNTGDYSAATNTGSCSVATNTGYGSAAANTGSYSAAANTGSYSAATNTGYGSAATNTGYYSAATNTGDRSAATNTGYGSAATNTGSYSAATNTGNCSAATNTGSYSAATNTGNCSAATNTGDRSAATNTGDCSAATNTGRCSVALATGNYAIASVEKPNSVAIATGFKGGAKGAIGSALFLVERHINGDIIHVASIIIDGLKYKENTFYSLNGGVVIELKRNGN